ncbi:MAG: N-acetyltransferase [Hyphomonas sp.]|nr:N-acetyltransferase [Hyphomonas sp.]MCA8903379.1 N-acetyltransferase [Hyphomonas sp.]MCB9970550.1 N-acetyltransferase [Hyphomonas sp.]
MTEILHDEMRMRYSLFAEGLEAYLTYERPTEGHRHITHTIVPGPLGGRGYGSRLVKQIMQDVIAAGETVSSECWFASALIEKKAEWAAALA